MKKVLCVICSLFYCSFLRNFWELTGCARVAGDEEEDGIDDLENEFNFMGRDKQDMQYLAEAMLQGHMSYGRAGDVDMSQAVHMPQVPLLTNGEMVFHGFLNVEIHKTFEDPSLGSVFPFMILASVMIDYATCMILVAG